MATHKISLMDAYLIETLRSNGITNEEIVSAVKVDHVEPWQELHKQFDFEELLKLAHNDIEQFQEILERGYQVKFVTFNGLRNLLRMRFDKEQDKDYELMEKGIRNLVLNHEQFVRVKQMISENWVLKEEENQNVFVVSIELIA